MLKQSTFSAATAAHNDKYIAFVNLEIQILLNKVTAVTQRYPFYVNGYLMRRRCSMVKCPDGKREYSNRHPQSPDKQLP